MVLARLQENCNKIKDLYYDYDIKLFDDDLIKVFLVNIMNLMS